MISNLIIWSMLIVVSYPISRYFMRKAMVLDLSMPFNMRRYKNLCYFFRTPLLNVVIMFTYLCIMLHKFERI